ncbi:MAG: amino acid ABC transporter ATP-binding/permease protein [Candidatus Fimenecus sp.]
MTSVKRRSGFKIMSRLILLLESLSYIMLLAVINGSAGFICAIGITLFGAIGIAKLLGESIVLSYTSIIVLCISCGILRGVLKYFEQYSNHYIAFKLLAVLRDKIFNVLRKLCPAKLETKQKGSIIAMITSDIETLEVFYAHTVSPICIAILVSLFMLIFIGIYSNIYFMIIALLGYVIIGILFPLVFSKHIKKSGVIYRREFSLFNAFFLDSIKGISDIVLNNAGRKRASEVNERSDRLISETRKMKKTTARFFAYIELTVSAIVILSLVTGIILLNNGEISIGRMIIGVVSIFGSFGSVIAVAALPSNLTQTFASGDRILNLLDEKPAVEPVINGETILFENLCVDDLSFSYNQKNEVLKNISLSVEKGEIVGIVGESGCGKSTLLKLLLRFFQKKYGNIYYNGIEIDSINSDNLLQNITMVSQNTYLFDDTILENLRIANNNATINDIKEACKLASVNDFIEMLPDGYNSKVGVSGSNLSSGERQRIGLARAFLSGAKLILLDEPTSNVDSINEGIILSALKQQKKHRGIILVSHRESTMAIADRIYKIENGKIQEVI